MYSNSTLCQYEDSVHVSALTTINNHTWTGITSAVVGEIDLQCAHDKFENFRKTDEFSLHFYRLNPVALIKRMNFLGTCHPHIELNLPRNQ